MEIPIALIADYNLKVDAHIAITHAFELKNHPFFVGALFQPELSALKNNRHPLINAFIAKCIYYLENNQ